MFNVFYYNQTITGAIFGPNPANDRTHMFKSELANAIRKIRQHFQRQNDQQRNELYMQFAQFYDEITLQYHDLGHLFLNERVKQEEERVRTDIQRIRTDSNLLK